MPLPQKATPDLVARLAAEIHREQQREPTAEEILAQLGGSKSTVTRLLRAWREERDRARAVVLPEEVRPHLSAALERAATEVWTLAQQHADARHAEAERVMQARLAEIEGDLAGVEAELDAAQQALAEAQAQRDAAIARAEELAAQLSTPQVHAQAHQIQAEAAVARADALERQAAQQAEELRQARAQALEQARALGELDALRRQVEQLQALLGQRQQGQG
jgi:DNA repair exonuclease SbcCD ATPase subunit